MRDEEQKQIKEEFEIVLNDIDGHKTKILNKLSAMLTDIIKKSMKEQPPEIYTNKQKVENLAELPSSPYIQRISKSMNSLNKVISNNLSEESRKIIFTVVFPQFIDEIESFVDEHFLNDNNEEGFEVFKHDLGHLEREITELAKNISTGQAFIHKIREIQQADLNDFDLEEEEEEDEFGN